MKKKKKDNEPVQLVKLKLNLTSPIKIDSEFELGKIDIFVGENGVGKSLILKIVYALGAVSVNKSVDNIEAAQFVFDNTFRDQNFDGSLWAIYTKGMLTVKLDKGKVTEVINDLKRPVPVVYMSSDMRTFDAMSLYLRVRKNGGDSPIALMQSLLGSYRLYDVTYMEALIGRCPIALPEQITTSLKDKFGFQESIKAIDADLDKCTFRAILDDGSKKDLATYGKGHQAILNMFVGVSR